MAMSDLIELAKAAERLAQWARFCQQDVDNQREPKLGEVRRAIAALRVELEQFEQ